jgi:hypothetical protein
MKKMDENNERSAISKINSSTLTKEQKMALLGEVKLNAKSSEIHPVEELVFLP